MRTRLVQRRDDLIAELRRFEGRWPEIVKRANVSHSWLSQFARRKIPNPGIETLDRVSTAISELSASDIRAAG